MALTTKQKAFVAAYLGSAHRNAAVAAVMAGIQGSRAEALALVEHPEIRAELERRNTNAVVIDGKLLDVEPGSLKSFSGKKSGIRALKKESKKKLTIKQQIEKRKKSRERELEAAALGEPVIMTEDGDVAGTLEDNVARLEKVVTSDAYLKSMGTSDKLVAHLAQRYDETGKEGVVYNGADGQPKVVTRVKTRYDLKLWLSNVIDDPAQEIHVKMQAAALLGKSLGLFSERVIADEYKRETEIKDSSAAELREKIASQRARLARLTAPRIDAEVVSQGEVGEDSEKAS